MALEQQKVLVSDLKPGMYVADLDRSWAGTPFKMQGVLIRSEDDIQLFSKYCEFVFIDTVKSLESFRAEKPKITSALSDQEQKEFLIQQKPLDYPVKSELKDELKIASHRIENLRATLKNTVEAMFDKNSIEVQPLRKVINPMVDSVVRNPNAFAWLAMMKDRDSYTYNHMLSCSIWAAALGRNLGLPIKDIRVLSLGALLFDIGKLKLPEKLITKPGTYNVHEKKIVRRHVDYGLEIVKQADGIEDSLLEMIATHHERHDGSGYPKGLKGNNIPLFGRIAGIVDCYDGLISNNHYKDAVTPSEAVKIMYDWSNYKFQSELIEQFIQVLGVFPIGSVVELSDGRVGAVVSHQKSRRLRPDIMLILDADKNFYREFKHLNLAIIDTDGDGKPLSIVRTVNPAKYGIDPKYFYL